MVTFVRKTTRVDIVIQKHQLLWFTPQFKVISECEQNKSSRPVIQNKHSRIVTTNQYDKLSLGAGDGKF